MRNKDDFVKDLKQFKKKKTQIKWVALSTFKNYHKDTAISTVCHWQQNDIGDQIVRMLVITAQILSAWSIVALENTYQKGKPGLHNTLWSLIGQIRTRTLGSDAMGSTRREKNKILTIAKLRLSGRTKILRILNDILPRIH